MKEQENLIAAGGLGLAAGLLLACLLGRNQTPKSCGCEDESRFLDAKPVNPDTMGFLGNDGPKSRTRRWLWCSEGEAWECTGPGMQVLPDGTITGMTGNFCSLRDDLEGVCGDGDYFLTIPVPVQGTQV